MEALLGLISKGKLTLIAEKNEDESFKVAIMIQELESKGIPGVILKGTSKEINDEFALILPRLQSAITEISNINEIEEAVKKAGQTAKSKTKAGTKAAAKKDSSDTDPAGNETADKENEEVKPKDNETPKAKAEPKAKSEPKPVKAEISTAFTKLVHQMIKNIANRANDPDLIAFAEKNLLNRATTEDEKAFVKEELSKLGDASATVEEPVVETVNDEVDSDKMLF